ncbi:MAG: class I SAM-dependent methyltransferase [Pseudanabaena sp. CRU_2_10]|nr:class I SAM-dependent methyltransferase [Pseudanabaena sp. CRU_2_10]
MMQATIDLKTVPGYEVLAAAGKTVLRPGGRAATEQLLRWANFQPGDTVLELASGLGTSAIALAKRYGVNVTGIEKSPERVAIAQARVESAGLSDRVQIIQGDIFHLESIAKQFDYVLAEAILTMQSATGKNAILQGVRDRLKPGGQFLSHELLVLKREAQLHRILSTVNRVNATPLTLASWITAYAKAGLQVQEHQCGAMQLLHPLRVIQDEGLGNALQIVWNVLTHPSIRQRVLAMRHVFQKYQQELNYVIFVLKRSNKL